METGLYVPDPDVLLVTQSRSAKALVALGQFWPYTIPDNTSDSHGNQTMVYDVQLQRSRLVLLRWQELATRLVAVFFLTCHRGAHGKYRSVSKPELLMDIWIANSRWPFLLCFELGHVIHLFTRDMLPGL